VIRGKALYIIDKPRFRTLLTVTYLCIYSTGAVKKLLKYVSTERGIRVDEATVTFPLQSTHEVKYGSEHSLILRWLEYNPCMGNFSLL